MAERYLNEVFNKIKAKNEVKVVVKSIFEMLFNKTKKQVKEKYLDSIFNKQKTKKIEKNEVNDEKKGKNIITSQVREENFQEFKQKEEETKEFVKKLKKEQKERERRMKEREEEQSLKLKHEHEEEEREKRKAKRLKVREKIRVLKKLQQKAKARKEEIRKLIENGNEAYKKVLTSKPLYEKLEEKYFRKVIMPELQRHKLELAKKREMFQPLNRSAILEHAKIHDQLIEEHEMLHKKKLHPDTSYDASKLRSKFTEAYLEEQKLKRLENDLEIEERKKLLAKKKLYSELILEMYSPPVDPAKQLELKLLKEKAFNSSSKLNSLSQNIIKQSYSAKEGLSESQRIRSLQKKWKPNKMVPQPLPKKEPFVIDWLAEKRKNRQVTPEEKLDKSIEWDNSYSEEKVKKRLQKIEKEVRKHEIILESTKPTNLKAVEESDQINTMIINGIKGKLALLSMT